MGEAWIRLTLMYTDVGAHLKFVLCSDQRRLEIRGDGVGQAVLVDIHVGRDYGIRGHNPTGSHAVRQSIADQRPVVRSNATHTDGQTKL